MFLVGPNASGKSNVLDAFRFLRDVADPNGGGFQAAVGQRGGVSQIRSLHARRYPNVVIDVEMDLNGDGGHWRYRLEFSQDNQRTPKVSKEQVWRGAKQIVRAFPWRRIEKDTHSPSRLVPTTTPPQS